MFIGDFSAVPDQAFGSVASPGIRRNVATENNTDNAANAGINFISNDVSPCTNSIPDIIGVDVVLEDIVRNNNSEDCDRNCTKAKNTSVIGGSGDICNRTGTVGTAWLLHHVKIGSGCCHS